MPSAKEAVVNKPLSGPELRELLLADFERLLANDGMLAPHIAYARVRYQIILRKHVDNPFQGPGGDESFVVSQPAPPIADPTPDAEVTGATLTREIDSPNAERLRSGMAIPIQRKQQDGTTITEQVKYPPEMAEQIGDGDVRIEDTTAEAGESWRVRR